MQQQKQNKMLISNCFLKSKEICKNHKKKKEIQHSTSITNTTLITRFYHNNYTYLSQTATKKHITITLISHKIFTVTRNRTQHYHKSAHIYHNHSTFVELKYHPDVHNSLHYYHKSITHPVDIKRF